MTAHVESTDSGSVAGATAPSAGSRSVIAIPTAAGASSSGQTMSTTIRLIWMN